MDIMKDFVSGELCIGSNDISATSSLRNYNDLQQICLRILGAKGDWVVSYPIKSADLSDMGKYANNLLLSDIENRVYGALKPVFGKNVGVRAMIVGPGRITVLLSLMGKRFDFLMEIDSAGLSTSYSNSNIDLSKRIVT